MSKIEVKQKYYKPEGFKEQFSEILTTYNKFLFVPGKKDEELDKRDFLFNRLKSKRKFYSKLNNLLTKIGIVVVLVIATMCVFAPWLSKYSFELVSGVDKSVDAYAAPSPEHIFGVTKFGRDVLGRLIWGCKIFFNNRIDSHCD